MNLRPGTASACLLLAVGLSACGDDGDSRTSPDSQATDSIAAYLSDGHGLLDRAGARCVAAALIKEQDAQTLQEVGFLNDDLTVNDQPNPRVAEAFTDAWLDCSSLGVWEAKGGTGADCIDASIDDDAAHNYMVADLGGEDANMERAQVTGDLIAMCTSSDG